MDYRIEIALKNIRSEFAKQVTVKHLAENAGVSTSWFGRLFQRETGQGVKRYIRTLRMEEAEKLLLDRKLLVKEVSAAVGYACPRNFTRDFAKSHGKPPSRSRSPSTAGLANKKQILRTKSSCLARRSCSI